MEPPTLSQSAIALDDRLRGGMLGALIGDALGVPYEFKSPAQLPSLSDIEMQPPPGFHRSWAGIAPGTWSDDGALALCLLASLNDCCRFDLDDFATRICRWLEEGYMAVDHRVFDVGNATRAGIRRMQSGISADQAGGRSEADNGNGALMRVLPLALWHCGSDAELVADARRSSLPTHGHLRSQLCCALYCLWARALLANEADAWSTAVATMRALCIPESTERLELETRILSFELSQCSGSGYVVDSLHSSRLALMQPDYEQAMKFAIALGNDTDTTACIAGGLAGIRWGVGRISARWLNALRDRPMAEAQIAHLLATRSR